MKFALETEYQSNSTRASVVIVAALFGNASISSAL